jgi:hypothetical protein
MPVLFFPLMDKYPEKGFQSFSEYCVTIQLGPTTVVEIQQNSLHCMTTGNTDHC